MGYLNIIKTSILLFPVLAFFITMPYAVWMYRKYGSINFIKTLIVYSFVLYLESSFLLVNLPLPEPGSVHNGYLDMISLVPFGFVKDFITKSPLNILQPATYLQAIKHGTFYVPAFNIVMLIPFGMYLRYYFKFSFKKTVLYTALLSLFFELTQLSGLFFIYDGPYRLCDIDDIIQNTLGGASGYLLAGFLCRWLPSRDSLDDAALKKGEEVSGLRRILAFVIDMFVIKMISSLVGMVIPFAFIFVFAAYFVLLPIKDGNTIGSKLLNFHFEMEDKNIIKLLFRSLGMLLYFYGFPKFVVLMMNAVNGNVNIKIIATIVFILVMLFIAYVIFTIFVVLTNRLLPFDKIMGVRYFSDIKTNAKNKI